MPRYKLLQLVNVSLVAPVIGPPSPKVDVEVQYIGVDNDGRFSFHIPTYDLASHHQLDALHVSLYEKPADGSAPSIPLDPAEVVKGTLHYSIAIASLQGGGTVVVD